MGSSAGLAVPACSLSVQNCLVRSKGGTEEGFGIGDEAVQVGEFTPARILGCKGHRNECRWFGWVIRSMSVGVVSDDEKRGKTPLLMKAVTCLWAPGRVLFDPVTECSTVH